MRKHLRFYLMKASKTIFENLIKSSIHPLADERLHIRPAIGSMSAKNTEVTRERDDSAGF